MALVAPHAGGSSILGAGPGTVTKRIGVDEFGNAYVTNIGAGASFTSYTQFDTVANNQELIVTAAVGKYIRVMCLILSIRGGAAEGYIHWTGALTTGEDSNCITPFAFDDHGGLILREKDIGGSGAGVQVDITSLGAGAAVDAAVKYKTQEWAP